MCSSLTELLHVSLPLLELILLRLSLNYFCSAQKEIYLKREVKVERSVEIIKFQTTMTRIKNLDFAYFVTTNYIVCTAFACSS